MVDEKIDPKRHYTATEVASLLDVSVDTVRRWYRLGYIKAALFGEKNLYFVGKNLLEAMDKFTSSKKLRKLKRGTTVDKGDKS